MRRGNVPHQRQQRLHLPDSVCIDHCPSRALRQIRLCILPCTEREACCHPQSNHQWLGCCTGEALLAIEKHQHINTAQMIALQRRSPDALSVLTDSLARSAAACHQNPSRAHL